MKNKHIVGIASLLLITSNNAWCAFAYLEKVENNHPSATLYMLSTDETPGVYNQNNSQFNGWDIAKIPAKNSITTFDNYIFPYENHGGKIYLWLKDAKENIINAATIQEINGYVTFMGDNQLHTPNVLYIKDAMMQNVFTTLCSRAKDTDPLICKWERGSDMNQQYSLEIASDGTIVLTRYAESKSQCKWSDASCQFKKVGSFFEDVGKKMGDAFKDVGNNINKGFDKLGACMEVATLGTELAAKVAAKETILSGNLTDAIVQASQEAAIQPLIGARKGAEQILEAAKSILDASNKAAAGTLDVARQTASGTLKAGEVVATGVLRAADETTKLILSSFDIQEIRYEGSLQKLFKGNLGNCSCKAIIFKQKVDLNFDLNVHDPIDGIKKLANKIADKVVQAAQTSSSALKNFFTANETLYNQEDILKLTMSSYIKQHTPLELALK